MKHLNGAHEIVMRNGKAVADAIAARILTVDGALSGTLLGNMNVSKATEGGVITHN